MEVGKKLDLDLPPMQEGLPKVPASTGGVHLEMGENGAEATMLMDPKPFDPLRVGDVNRTVRASFDADGNLQVTTTLSGGCFPHTTPGASSTDLAGVRNAILEKLATMDPATPEAAAFHKLADALQTQLLRQVGTDGFHGAERPHHPLPPNVLKW